MPQRGEFKRGAKEASVKKRAFNARPEQKKRRAERNASRALMMKKGQAHKGDGKDVDHRNHRTGDKSASNLSMMSRSKNRALNQHDKRKRK